MVSGHWKDHRAVWESKSSAGLIVPAQATCNLPACDSPPNYPPVQPHCYPPVLILLLPIIICHWAKLSSRPAHHSARHHLRLWKAITKNKTRIYLPLLGFEQAWTSILSLSAPLCKLLALRDLSAYLGHHQFWAKSARQAIPGKRLKAAISLLGKGSIYPAFL